MPISRTKRWLAAIAARACIPRLHRYEAGNETGRALAETEAEPQELVLPAGDWFDNVEVIAAKEIGKR